MSKKRKISVRKILQVFVTLVMSTACIVAILSASRIADAKKAEGIDLQIGDENKYHFLDKAELLKTLTISKGVNISRASVKSIDVHGMENAMLSNPWIGDAQVYIDNQRMVHVFVSQKVPVVRIFESNGSSYYLDTGLQQVPLSGRYVYYALVVTDVPHLGDDSASKCIKVEVLQLARFINKDPFWSAQVSQVMFDSANNAFEMLTVLGDQKVIIGDTSRLREKFNNLLLFYKRILNTIGWDKYEVLDLSFKGQVVASPALPWKAPAGKTVSNMDWVKSVLDQGAKQEETDSIKGENKKAVVKLNKPSSNKLLQHSKPPPVKDIKKVKPPDKDKDKTKNKNTQPKKKA
jgi:cell division protein FtsQ